MIREYKKENNTFLTSHHLFKGPDLGYKRYTLDYIGIPIAHCRSHPHEGNWSGNSPRKPASNLRMARGETCYTLNMTESHHLVRLDCKVSWWIGHIKSEIQPLEVSKQSSPKTKEATTWTRYGHDMGNWTRSRAFFWHVTNTLLSQRSYAACTGRPFKPQWYISRLIEPIAGDDSKRGDCTDFCTNLIPCPHLLKVYQMPLGGFSNVFELGTLSLSSKNPCNTWL
jgi:hypothetical protein